MLWAHENFSIVEEEVEGGKSGWIYIAWEISFENLFLNNIDDFLYNHSTLFKSLIDT